MPIQNLCKVCKDLEINGILLSNCCLQAGLMPLPVHRLVPLCAKTAIFEATLPGVWTVIHTTARLWTTPCHAGKPA